MGSILFLLDYHRKVDIVSTIMWKKVKRQVSVMASKKYIKPVITITPLTLLKVVAVLIAVVAVEKEEEEDEISLLINSNKETSDTVIPDGENMNRRTMRVVFSIETNKIPIKM